jgi:transcription-repair coupling factor (superfamily II helicase)
MLIKELKKTREVQRVKNVIENYHSRPVALFGASGTAGAAYISAIAEGCKTPFVIVTKDDRSAAKLFEDMSFFSSECILFNSRDLTLRPLESFSRQYEYSRISTLGNIVGNRRKIVIASAERALMLTMPKENFLKNTMTVRQDDKLERDELINKLVSAGYVHRDMVEGPGQFAVRGDIVDLYTPDMNTPVRIEFWSDDIDRINTFDISSQRRLEKIEKVHISPAKEVLFPSVDSALKILHEFRNSLKGRAKDGFDKASEKEIAILKAGIMPQSMDKFISICYERKATLFDYMPDCTIVLYGWFETKDYFSQIQNLQKDEIHALQQEGILSRQMDEYYKPIEYLVDLCKQNSTVVCEDFVRTTHGFPLSEIVSVNVNMRGTWNGEYRVLADDLKALVARAYKTVVLAGTEKAAENLALDLEKIDISAQFLKNDTLLNEGTVYVCAGHVLSGFELPAQKLCLLTGQKLNVSVRKKINKKNNDAIKSIDQINKGDYVVHQNYGLGIYEGVHSISMQSVTKDYLLIKFRGKDSLYVPVTQLDLISRYVNFKDGENVKLSKLGSDSWNKTKRRAKKATEEMAKDLIELYRARENTKGYQFDADTEWQRDFEARFPYEETADQLKSTSEIKKDMESPYPMDRLLCGDVGVGKTEVALRAAFKAVMSGKQVAILVPTTVLAWQHYNTIIGRMGSFPINVQMLSRFRTPRQRKATVKDINQGVADIVVGTHALIQKNVKFKNLGLLIVDEEQRFGVAQKEKLVSNFHGVDVLTLSATPIPRTLSMALNGIRDMSFIEQPPIDRVPIETYVTEYSPGTVAAALNRELNRGGQCYYLHNRVESIDSAAQRVGIMCPDARIGIAHGQMDERSLSEVWQRLINGQIDILVCTTIIETGVDVPNCNTLIIEDSDKMGLAQLYQIRGRVGRSTRKAYAYFTFRRDKALSEVAVKRLNAIKEFTSFGSGYKIAMRDLQIRGAGSVLGKTQSGFMTKVGYDLYMKLLNQAISLQKGELIKSEKSDCVIDIAMDAFIPEDYIKATQNRIEAYKKIASLENEEDKDDLIDELLDRYGDVPQSVLGLMDISILRVKAAAVGITEIKQIKNNLMFYGSKFSGLDINKFFTEIKLKVAINDSDAPYISVTIPKTATPLETMNYTLKIFESCMMLDRQ